MKRKNIGIIVVVNLIFIGLVFLWFYFKTPKIAYIKTQTVYNEFILKKELETKYKSVTNARKNILDSLEIKLKSMNLSFKNIHDNKILEQKKEEFKTLSEEFYLKKKKFDEDNQRVTNDYESQILKQLNQYIYDYGKEIGVDFIYGASGNGNIMYGSEKFDVTDGAVKYVNERYSGERK